MLHDNRVFYTSHCIISAPCRSTVFFHIISYTIWFSKKKKKKRTECKTRIWFFIRRLSEKFLNLRRAQRDVINILWAPHEVTFFPCQILIEVEFSRLVFENSSNIKRHEIRSFGASRHKNTRNQSIFAIFGRGPMKLRLLRLKIQFCSTDGKRLLDLHTVLHLNPIKHENFKALFKESNQQLVLLLLTSVESIIQYFMGAWNFTWLCC